MIAYGQGNFFLLTLCGKPFWPCFGNWRLAKLMVPWKKIKLSKRTVTNKETIPKSLLRERLYRQLLTPINEMRSKFNVLQMAYLHPDMQNNKGFCQYSGQTCLTVFLHNVQINFTIYYGFLQSFVFLQFVKKYLLWHGAGYSRIEFF